jgi:hypothetical protein
MLARVRGPRWIVLVVALLALRLPSLGAGFAFDDHVHQLVLAGEPHATLRPWSLYDFGSPPGPGEPEYELGAFPWWTSPDLSVRFFRPLTSLSLALDHALFGQLALGYHATSLLLFGLLLTAAHALYRALGLSRLAAALALAILALEDGGSTPVTWIANRNSLLEALCMCLALLALARRRALGDARAIGLALLGAACATASKESGIATFGLIALALLFEARGARIAPARAVAGIALSIAAVGLYLAWLLGSGYGARSAFYPVPWSAPRAWIEQVGFTFACAPAALSTPYSTDLAFVQPEFARALLVLALVLGSPCVWLLVRFSARLSVPRYWLGWIALCLLPQAAAPPSDRLYFTATLGAAPLLAQALLAGWAERRWLARVPRLLVYALLLSTTLVSGAALLVRQQVIAVLGREARERVLTAEVGPAELGPRDALVLQSASAMAALAPVAVWSFEHPDDPVGFFPLQMARRGLRWTRTGDMSCELACPTGAFADAPLEAIYLSRAGSMRVGQSWRTASFEVRALEVEGGYATRIELVFPRSLDDARLAFLAERDGRWQRLAPPAAGETIELPELERPNWYTP